MNENLPADFSTLCDLRSAVPAHLTSETLRFLKNSVMKEKYNVVRDINDRPIGYIAWASVNIETLQRLNRTGIFPQYFYEWDEGDITLILDILLILQQKEITMKTLISDFVRQKNKIAYVKRDRLFFFSKSNDRFRLTPVQINFQRK